MFKIQEIREIIRLIDQSSINEFTYENDGASITLKKNSSVASALNGQQVEAEENDQQPAINTAITAVETTVSQEKPQEPIAQNVAQQEDTDLVKIESPMVGTFYAAPAPDKPPYVEVGAKVQAETVVCIVEAMKLFNEIEAEVKGEIVEILVENGQLVEYGQPLFLVKPE